ncbi:MAG: transglutaminase domain-containing protein [Lachnospiraceae bacterium]|nr:transglutaminase domain-containing protein [Lachnospiraceae bacterium]
MKKMKKLFTIFVAMILLTGTIPSAVFATQEEVTPVKTIYVEYVNPVYADTIQVSKSDVPVYLSDEYCTSVQDAAEIVRSAMQGRQETVKVGLKLAGDIDSEGIKELIHEIADTATEHTGNPTEGDYLDKQYGGWSAGCSYYTSGNTNYMTFTYQITYYTTKAQEQQVDTKVAQVLQELGLSGKTDYQKICAIYDYVCDHVTYDYANLDDDSYKLKYTAYAALMNGTAVCQGYANLMYRLLLEEGIDCRIVTGIGNGGPHAWNIVYADGMYYCLDATWDATWDAGSSSYQYFMRGSSTFEDHTLGDDFTTKEFQQAYPVSTTDYVPSSSSVILDKTNGMAFGIDIGTSFSTLKQQLKNAFVLTDKNHVAVSDTGRVLRTGDYIQMTDASGSVTGEYQICIKGDVNGDGVANVLDMEEIQKDILGIGNLETVFYEAAKLKDDRDTITVYDMEIIQKYILGIGSIN